jgi:hypothetical protein
MRYLILLLGVIVMLFSCSKNGEYIQKPTCYRYLELSDKYNGELIYLRTDTLWPQGRYNNVACGDDTLKLMKIFPLEGCDNGGFQRMRYLLIR